MLNRLDLPSTKQVQLNDFWERDQLGSISNEIHYELSPLSSMVLKLTL
jgi:hypothetical protein